MRKGNTESSPFPTRYEHARCSPIGESFRELIEKIKAKIESQSGTGQPDDIPQEPKTNNLTDWFDYLHSKGHGRITLLDIAKKTNYEYSTVRKEHSLYMKRNELPSNRKVTKSNKK